MPRCLRTHLDSMCWSSFHRLLPPTSIPMNPQNHCFSWGKPMLLRVQGIEIGSKNRWKIDPKMESRWEGILASIFNGFWWIFGSKLGRKMEPRSIQEGIEKGKEKWIASRWPKSRNKTSQPILAPGVRGPGEVPPFKAGQSSGAGWMRRLVSTGIWSTLQYLKVL